MGNQYNKKDYVGQRYGTLIVVKDTGEKQVSPSGHTKCIWLLRCDCGNEVTKTTQSLCNWAVSENKRSGAHCGCKIKRGSDSIAYEIWRAEYSDGDISFDQFIKLSQQNCFHCGSKVHDSGRIKIRTSKLRVNGTRTTKNTPTISSFQYHGLDRIDNHIGHMINNILPCCWPCNNLRGGRSLSAFLDHINKIIDNYSKKHEEESSSS